MDESILLKKIKEIYEMRLSNAADGKSLIIPHFQRGLVWTPKQITDLWDSISKGYPLGVFMCLPASNHTDQGKSSQGHYLMDGQQRCNAICIGVDDGIKNSQQLPATLWVDWDELEAPRFMVCTPRHPWGFKWKKDNLVRFSADEMHKANLFFKKGKDTYKENFEERYEIASLYAGWPFDESHFKHPIPVPYLFPEDQSQQHSHIIEKYKIFLDRLSDEQSLFPYAPPHLLKYLEEKNDDPHIKETMVERFSAALSSKWIERMLEVQIPLIIIQSNQLSGEDGTSNVDRVEELFSRINNGGTRLNYLDAIYSHITAYWGEIKESNEKIADEFMPANRFVSLAGRLAKARAHAITKKTDALLPEYPGPLHHQELIQWRKEDSCLEYQEFKKLYKISENDYNSNQLLKIKETFQELTKDIPSYIYLKDDDKWLFILFMILDLLLQNGSDIDSGHFKQLCMLPYVLSAATSHVARESFCRAFYKAATQSPVPQNLKEIMIRGIIFSSVHEETFMYPLPSFLQDSIFPSQLNFYNESISTYGNYWWQNFSKYTGTNDNPFLYFYLRDYINKMKFNPALRSSWDGNLNKPWDMDHIVPQTWWDKNSGEQHFVGNMQPLYFSDNRRKNDSCIGIKMDTHPNDDQLNKELRNILRYNDWDLNSNITGKNRTDCKLSGNEDYMKHISFPRFKTMASFIYDDLKLNELIKSINEYGKKIDDSAVRDIVTRYRVFCKIHTWLHEQFPEQKILWGTVIYEWKQQQKSVRDTIMIPILESGNLPTFYESLTPWLSIGIEIKDGYLCACASGKQYEIGIRRPFGRSEIDQKMRQKFSSNSLGNNPWWYTVDSFIFEEQSLDELRDSILEKMKKLLQQKFL